LMDRYQLWSRAVDPDCFNTDPTQAL
jgi:hypothetical protein